MDAQVFRWFSIHTSEVLAPTRLCLCDKCKAEYGSCHLFTSHELRTLVLKESILRSRNIQTEEQNTQNQSEIVHEFLLSGSICAIAASEKSYDTVWFVKIVTTDIASQSIRDDYGHVIQEGSRYIEGRYLEICTEKKHFMTYRVPTAFCKYFSRTFPWLFKDILDDFPLLLNSSNSGKCDIESKIHRHRKMIKGQCVVIVFFLQQSM